MLITPFKDWLAEQEHKRPPLIFLLEWLLVFALAMPFWVVLLLEIRNSPWLIAGAAAFSSLYASAFVYVRLMGLAACRKCRAPLALTEQELGRRPVHEEERCLEIEHGGEEWYGHYVDLYARRYRVEIVKYRCRWCKSVWEQRMAIPADEYTLIRTIEVED